MTDTQGRPAWQPDPDPAFIITVRDHEWFIRTMAKAIHAGRVAVIHAVDDYERQAIRPDVKAYGEPVGW